MSSHAVSTAVIGAGDWGKNHVRKFHELGSLKAICESNDLVAQKMFDDFGVPNKTFEDIIQDPEINAIVLASCVTSDACAVYATTDDDEIIVFLWFLS